MSEIVTFSCDPIVTVRVGAHEHVSVPLAQRIMMGNRSYSGVGDAA